MSRRSKMSRRNFVRTGVGTVVAATYFGPRNLFAVRKPALTNQTLTEHFSRLRGSDQYAREIGEAKTNLGVFLRNRFDLTRQQMKNLESLPRENVRALGVALDRAAAAEMPIKVVGATDKGECARLLPRFESNTLIIEVISSAKPPITDELVNTHFRRLRGTDQLAREVSAVKADLPAYLGERFALTPVQVQNLRALPAQDLRDLKTALDRAVDEDLGLRLVGAAKGGCQRLLTSVTPDAVVIEIR